MADNRVRRHTGHVTLLQCPVLSCPRISAELDANYGNGDFISAGRPSRAFANAGIRRSPGTGPDAGQREEEEEGSHGAIYRLSCRWAVDSPGQR